MEPLPLPPRCRVLKPGPGTAGHPLRLGWALWQSWPDYAPPSAAPGRSVGGTVPLRAQAWEVAQGRRAFRELFPPGGGRTQGAAHWSATRYAQVRRRADRERLLHIHAGRRSRPCPPEPRIGLSAAPAPQVRPRPIGAGLRGGAGPGARGSAETAGSPFM